MTKNKLVIVAACLILAATAINAYIGFDNYSRINDTQQQLLTSQKASTKTRVTTVTSRCNLTALVVAVVAKLAPAAAPPFVESYMLCEKQLKQVVGIDRNTPEP